MEPTDDVHMCYFNDNNEMKIKTACYRHFTEQHKSVRIVFVQARATVMRATRNGVSLTTNYVTVDNVTHR